MAGGWFGGWFLPQLLVVVVLSAMDLYLFPKKQKTKPTILILNPNLKPSSRTPNKLTLEPHGSIHVEA
jgi:hypothetical protein